MSEVLDIFVTAGQSQWLVGNAAQATPVVQGTVFTFNNAGHLVGGSAQVITDIVEPVYAPGAVGVGSPSSAFGARYYELTGRKVLIVPAAMGATVQSVKAAQGGYWHWDTSAANGGPLAVSLVTVVNAAVSAAFAAGYEPFLCGILWEQGETDAAILVQQPANYTIADYRLAYTNMRNFYRGKFGRDLPFFVIRIGTSSPVYEPGMAKIRAEQDLAATLDRYAPIVFRDTVNFKAQGFLAADDLHWNQDGANAAGNGAAEGVVASSILPWQ